MDENENNELNEQEQNTEVETTLTDEQPAGGAASAATIAACIDGITISGTLAQVAGEMQSRGAVDGEIAIGENSTNASVMPVSTTQIDDYEGDAEMILVAGATEVDENDDTIYNYTAKGAWAEIAMDTVIAGVLYATGIAIEEGMFEKEEAEEKFQAIRDDLADVKWFGRNAIPAIIAGDASINVPREVVEKIIQSAIDNGFYPGIDADVTTGIAIPTKLIFSGWETFCNYIMSCFENTISQVYKEGLYELLFREMPHLIPEDVNILTDVICIRIVQYSGDIRIRCDILHTATMATISLVNASGENVIWNRQNLRISVDESLDSNNRLTVTPTDMNGNAVPYKLYTFGTGIWWNPGSTWQWLTSDNRFTESQISGPTEIRPFAIGDAPAAAVTNIGTGYYEPVDGFAVIDGFAQPSSSDLATEYPNWDGFDVTNIGGTESTNFVGIRALVNNPTVDGTESLESWLVSQDMAQGSNPDLQHVLDIAAQALADAFSNLTGNNILDDLGSAVPDVGIPGVDVLSTLPEDFGQDTGADVGLVGLYNPTKSQLQSFAQWLWTDQNIIDALKKLFSSPIDAIISLYKVYAAPVIIGVSNINCGYIASPVSANTVQQYTEVDCGSVTIPKYYRNILDNNPHTKISIYLPFVGFQDLDIDDVVGGTIHVTYGVDVLTGSCLAKVTVTRDGYSPILYTYEGNCGVQLPVTSGEKTRYIAQQVAGAAGVVGSIASGNAVGAIASAAGMASNKVRVGRSGSITANAAVFGPRMPYVVISRPKTAEAYNYNNFYGVPANRTMRLGACAGFTRMRELHVDGIPATPAELEQIENLLKSGVMV